MDNDYYLAKWMDGTLSEAELLKYVSSKEIASYKRIIAHTDQYKKPALNSAEILKKVLKKSKKPSLYKKRSFAVFYRVAALLILSISVYYFTRTTSTTFRIKTERKLAFVLPDQSSVKLNAKSEVTYDKNNWKNHRDIHLKGEAYFKVTKGSKFNVQTPSGTVTVLGTKFNVLAREHRFEVTCFEGLVAVIYQNKKYLVPAKNSFKIVKDLPVLTSNITNKTPYWTENKSHFKSRPFHLVIAAFERQYHLEISYPNSLKNKLYTGEFPHNNKQQALNAIALPFNLSITHKKQQVILSK